MINKFLNPKNYGKRFLRLANSNVLGYLEKYTSPDPKLPLRYPPVFFLGPPRSGSTLAFQVITDVFDVGYISNQHCQCFGAPALVERFFHPTKHRTRSDFQSQLGETSGSFAPAECGQWWYRFFRQKPPYVSLDDVNPNRMRQFRRSIADLTDAFDRPVVFKNLYASLRIQAIAHYIPESLFIIMHRNEVDNGHSLLEARYEYFNDYGRWFSVEPPSLDRLKALPPHEQVIEQIRHIHKTITSDFEISGVDLRKRFDLSYEAFCDDPADAIMQIEDFFNRNNCKVSRRAEAPQKFTPREDVRIDRGLYDQLVYYSKVTLPVSILGASVKCP